MVQLTFARKDPPIGSVLACSIAGVSFKWCSETQLVLDDCVSLTTSQSISRHVARINPTFNLYPVHILHRTQVDHWLSVSSTVGFGGSVKALLPQLNIALTTSHSLVPPQLTVADYELFAALYRSRDWANIVASDDAPVHVLRWFNSVVSQVSSILAALPKDVKMASSGALGVPISTVGGSRSSSAASSAAISSGNAAAADGTPLLIVSSGKAAGKREEGGKFVELPDAKMGEVVVRFPPEASGYLHIGHAKAALLNQHYQLAFKGTLVMRFDDTNPAKEDAHFEEVILGDLKLLQIKPDRFTHTSDYFDLMLEYCEKLIKKGLAFVDDTDAETMKAERDERKDSRNRSNSAEKNLSMWEDMKKATASGLKCAVRAKIDMSSNNGCMRDPTIYRCKLEPHIRTGTKYKVYPTYDFACPIVDSIEGVTHALRTTEYHDRDEQFFWFLDKLELRKLHIYEYSRLNMNNTVLSKRKLAWFVEQGLVDGWDDPRFPTVRGILRRGMTVEGLKEFIISQGSSRAVVNMEWDKIWSFNKKVIDATAPRYVALEKSSLLPVNIANATEQATTAQKHPKDPAIGTKTVWIGPKILIEAVDAAELKEGQNATFINWGNLLIKKVNREEGKIISVDAETNLSNTDYKKTLKLTWLVDTSKAPLTPVLCVDFDHLISKGVLVKDEDFKKFVGHKTRFETSMLGDDELKQLKVGDIIQIQRKGFFRVDEPYKEASLSSCKESPIVLFSIPDGHVKEAATSAASKKTSMSAKEVAHSAKGKTAEKSPQEETKAIVSSSSDNVEAIHLKIKEHGDKIRALKAEKADKNVVLSEVAILKDLKSNFSSVTGVEWAPDINISQFRSTTATKSAAPSSGGTTEIHQKITDQGNMIRNLKANKAAKDEVTSAVNVLLSLKKSFKEIAGIDWTPSIDISQFNIVSAPATDKNNVLAIHQKINEQGTTVRNLKGSKADKGEITAAVNILLAHKKEFKEASGIDWTPNIDTSQFSSVTAASSSTITSAPVVAATTNDALSLHHKVVDQGNVVRNMKGSKAEKTAVTAAVNVLLALKKEFKEVSGLDWTPCINVSQLGDARSSPAAAVAPVLPAAVAAAVSPAAVVAVVSPAATKHTENNTIFLLQKIVGQGSIVRNLKGSKADKADITAAVNILLSLKKDFKDATGIDWTPNIDVSQFNKPEMPAASSTPADSNEPFILHGKIVDQGNSVRSLKGRQADKNEINSAVNVLLALKKEFKELSGLDWTPKMNLRQFSEKSPAPAPAASVDNVAVTTHQKVVDQGNLVRNLKSNKADKAEVTAAVNILIALKKEFRDLTGLDWSPNIDMSQATSRSSPVTTKASSSVFDELNTKVKEQGDKIRQLKSSNADKSVIKVEVDILLKHKEEFKSSLGVDWKPDMKASQLNGQISASAQPRASSKSKEVKSVKKEEVKDDGKKQTRLGLEVTKEECFSEWYSQVITKSEMIEYYNVSGCYILRPWSYSIWDSIKNYLDGEIKKLGVENCYFPIFVSRDALEKEKSHIADFSPEVAWVTRYGSSEMAEPIAIRPTSETAMYPAFSKWVQSHRDLPIRLNQWNNVVRWEFKQPTPFLRTREFLWQEGHSAFATKAEATEEVYQILDIYASVYEYLLAIPVIKGKKTEKEKFAGGDFTTTTEAFVSASGRGIQGATSHHLGQNFSKMFDIVYEDPTTQEKRYVYQNSWGLTTRSIGVMVMVHGDNKGLVLPPRVASLQAVIMPVGITAKVTDEEKNSLYDTCKQLEQELVLGSIRVKVDLRDHVTPAWKFNHWELKGVPLRLELGPREVAAGQVFVVRRDTGEKQAMCRSVIVEGIATLLDNIQSSMLERAREDLNAHKKLVSSWPEFVQTLDEKMIILAPFCGREDCENAVKKDSAGDQDADPGAPSMGAKSLCIPFQQPKVLPIGTLCIHPSCKQPAQYYCLFGRSY
uniref:Bifunctional glutamate/proline--tRNA ligase-like n=1 Tax=Hirondellea gigas TaxID=1518452 RepID=A0A6A7FM92_9CRUS